MIDPVIHPNPCAAWQRIGGDSILEISGNWQRDGPQVSVSGMAPQRLPVRYQAEKLGSYDSSLPAFLLALIRGITESAEGNDKPIAALDGLPAALRGLLALALAVPEENANQRIDPFMDDLEKVIKQANAGLIKIEKATADIAQITNPRAPTLMRFQNVLEEVERASRAIKELANDLKRNPDALLRGKAPSP